MRGDFLLFALALIALLLLLYPRFVEALTGVGHCEAGLEVLELDDRNRPKEGLLAPSAPPRCFFRWGLGTVSFLMILAGSHPHSDLGERSQTWDPSSMVAGYLLLWLVRLAFAFRAVVVVIAIDIDEA